MTKDLKTLLSEKNRLFLMFIIFIQLNIGCSKSPKIYYYILQENKVPISFIADIVMCKGEYMDIKELVYSCYSKRITDTIDFHYKVLKNSLYLLQNEQDKNGKCIFMIRKDTCIIWNHPDKIMNIYTKSKYCYVEKVGVDGVNLYKFNVEIGKYGDLKFKEFYDQSFILVRREGINGDNQNFVREITDNAPKKFKEIVELELKKGNF